MLENIDLSRKIDKVEFKQVMDEMELKLGELQRETIQLKIPIIIVFEGWDAAGKGTLINRLILNLDPRHFSVYSTLKPTEEERLRPFLWRFWTKTPAKGRMAIFDRSWYGRILIERVNKTVKKKEWMTAYKEIDDFERQLSDAGYVILKFFLHISKKEQKKRFEKLQDNPSTAWRVTREDWQHYKHYEEYANAVEDMIAKTDSGYAPWTIVETHDRRFATVKIFKAVIHALENRINLAKSRPSQPPTVQMATWNLDDVSTSILDRVDLAHTITREDYNKKLKQYQNRIRDLEHEVYVQRIPIVIVYSGWDAAGKGGNIKRLTQNMDPRGYEVIPIGAPNDIEKQHHYLWRFWMEIPKAGHIAIFDRSWYGRVTVERIEGFCTEEEWKRAYQEINEFEEQLTNFGTIVIKFWIHIDKDTQLQRFEERKNNPYKSWKLTDEDWRNREKWDTYKKAVDEMLFRTSSPHAPWTIIESNSKHYARIKAIKTVIDAIEKRL
jgi:polyphosphate:AMP phosphotransferase